jgi:hypothetical protein
MNARAQQPTIFLTINPRDRVQISTSIDALINLLDQIDPDPNLEASGDEEPWLGRAETMHQGIGTYGGDDDREGTNEDGREDSLDAGATEHGIA